MGRSSCSNQHGAEVANTASQPAEVRHLLERVKMEQVAGRALLAAAHALPLRLEELLQVLLFREPRRVAGPLAVFEIPSVVRRAENLTHDSPDPPLPHIPASTSRWAW